MIAMSNRTQEEPPTLPATSPHAFRTCPFLAWMQGQCPQLKARTESLRAGGVISVALVSGMCGNLEALRKGCRDWGRTRVNVTKRGRPESLLTSALLLGGVNINLKRPFIRRQLYYLYNNDAINFFGRGWIIYAYKWKSSSDRWTQQEI